MTSISLFEVVKLSQRRQEMKYDPRTLQIGQIVNNFEILEYAGKDNGNNSLWIAKCPLCGERTPPIRGSRIKNKETKSCGCLVKENGKNLFKHGMWTTRTWSSWSAMISRCTNKKVKEWDNYGGRGITVCERWLNSFEAFLEDMGERPKRHTIERLNNAKGYYKENCSWEIMSVQNRNKRNNRLISFNNKTQCLMDWSIELNIPYSCLQQRLDTLNWSIEEALTTPVGKGGK